MLEHLNATPQKPSRVVVMGSGSFVGGAIINLLLKQQIPVLALGRQQVDLLASDASYRLAGFIQPSDSFVAVSAIAPCKNSLMLVENVVLARAMVQALVTVPVAHVVNISSDAVYADGPLPLTERSSTAPTSLHGAMHLARELMFKSEVSCPLAFVRPTLLYGLDDPHNGYGPNRFRRLASEGKDILLFGEGEERRDHADVEDVAELVALILAKRSMGVVNAASGETVSFRTLAELAASDFPAKVGVKGQPRVGPMPHNGYRSFDTSALMAAFPGFRFKGWREGLARVHAMHKRDIR